jgi:predicted transcriptional regulator
MGQLAITVNLDPGVQAKLAAIAEERGKPVSDLAAEAIASFVEVERWQEQHIRQGIEELEAGKGMRHERVAEWLDSWGTENELSPPR